MRPGAGRKPKPKNEKQRNRLVVLLTDDELRQLNDAAADEPLSTFARRVLFRSVNRRHR